MNGSRLITDYPADHVHMRMAGVGAVSLHLFLVLLVAFLAWVFQVKSLKDLMAAGGTVEESGPAPAEQVEISLVPEEEPPPPTETPDFAREVVKPPPPPPVPVVKPKQEEPKPTPKPHYTAEGATGNGASASSSHLVVGSSGFPHPGYPFAAKKAHQTGTVTVSVQFDGSGQAVSVEVVESSGVAVLDTNTRSFIRSNWRNPAFAGRNCTVPVQYILQ